MQGESWDSLYLTAFLSGLHALLYVSLLIATLRPAFTLFHLFLAAQTIAFVLRPFLSVFEGGFSLYGGSWELYNQGLLLNLLANGIVGIGYLIAYTRSPLKSGVPLRWSKNTLARGTWLSFILALGALTLIHLFSGGAWLPTARNAAITQVVPFGKILFPLAVIPFSFSLTSGMLLFYLSLRQGGKPLWQRWFPSSTYLLISLASAVFLTLLYQRGFILSSILVLFFLLSRLNGWGYLRLAFVALFSLLLLTQLRPLATRIANALSGESQAIVQVDQPPFLQRYFLYSPNFDTADVWPVALSYVEQNGHLGGSTLLGIPMRFLPPATRLDWDFLTAVDVLNAYHWGDTYWEKSFGFNVILAQEVYLNFGPAGLSLLLLSGVVGSWLDRKIWAISVITPTRLYALFAAFFTGIPVGELGGILQWALAYLIYGLALGTLASIRVKRRRDTPPLPHHPR